LTFSFKMLAYTIYIIGTRKFLPHEGKKNQHFQQEGYKDARASLLQKVTFAAAASVTTSSSTAAFSSSIEHSTVAEKEEAQICSSSSSSAPSLLTPPLILSTPPIASSSSSSSSTSTRRGTGSSSKLLGFEKAQYLHGHFYFNSYNEEEKERLNQMWLNPIIQIGEVVAGDEKLYHYTAHHMNTKAVPQKKDVSNLSFLLLKNY